MNVTKKLLMRLPRHLVLLLLAGVVLYPLLLMVVSSFKPLREIYQHPFAWPSAPTLANFATAWTTGKFGVYVWNSIYVASVSVVGVLAASSMAAFVLARFTFRGNRLILVLFLIGMMLPLRLAVLPIFVTLKGLHLLNSHLGLILVYAALGIPFSIFLLTDFYRNIPKEIEESAFIDGANYFETYLYISLPIMRPALATVAIFNFITIWNDFFFPLVLLRSPKLFTVPLGLFDFVGMYGNQWNYLYAGLTLATLPTLILYFFLSRQVIAGLTVGAVKG